MAPNVVVIGSGLSAAGALKALVRHGIKPTVMDWGEAIDPVRAKMIDEMAHKKPGDWSQAQRDSLSRNETLNTEDFTPEKPQKPLEQTDP